MPESPYPMIPLDEALTIIEHRVSVLRPIRLPFDQALGYVLAEDVQAAEPMPPFPAAAVDGFAVIAADGPGWHQIVGDQVAGYMAELQITPGTAARVTTGAPIPAGADTMVMVEETETRSGQVNIMTDDLKPGNNIRPVGLEIAAGQLVLAQSTRLGAAELGLLATVGKSEVTVYQRPVVAVMSTGDEIIDPASQPQPGQIRDANRFTLMSLVRQMGLEPLDMGIVRDEAGGLERLMEQALSQAQVLLTSGGVSMGQLDLVKPYLAARGTVHFGRVSTKPGKPVTFATVAGTYCFAMPGFPVSAMVCFEVFVRPALLKMMGHPEIYPPRHQAILAHDFQHTAARTEFQRVILTRQADGRLMAQSTGFQGSGRLLSMSGANGFVILPQGQGNYPAGSLVEAVLLEIV